MSTYLKYMGGYTYKQLKGKSFDEIQKLFDKEMKRVNTFVALGSEVQESKENKIEEEDKESDEVSEDDKGELMNHLVIKKDEDIAIDAIPLATKLPMIIDYKLHKEGMLVHYQLIRADGSSKRYSSMIRMLQGIDREDLEALWKTVKTKYSDIRPKDEFERVLWGDLKVMFELDIRSDVWRMLQGYTAKDYGKATKRFGINKWYQSFALRNFDLEDMELESTNSGPTAKLPILKLSEYEMWVIRIKQYLQIHDYALWEVIENGDSWVSVPQTTQENESLDSIFNRLQKIVSRLAILVVWMNKPEVETMSIVDLYNNFKIIEQKVKKSVGGSSGAQNLAFIPAPSTNSTNDTNISSPQVSIASPNVNVASPQVSTASTKVDDIIDDAKSVSVVSEIPTVTTVDELTLAQALAELKSAKLLTQGISFREPSVATTTITAAPEPTQDKGKAQEQEELSNAEKATLFVQLLEKRRKHFAAKRAEEKRNKPPTQAQQRKIMCTYLKNMEGKKPKDFKNKYFDSIQKMFDRAFKRQKVDDDKETTELKSLMEVMPDEEENALDAIPLAVKSPSIVDWKIHIEGKKIYYQIIRADGSSKMYLVFSHMLKIFDREDLETLYKLVKAKYRSTRPVEDLDLVLYGDLKTMFEPHVEDNVCKNQSDYRVLDWKLYDSYRVHSLRKQNVHIHIFLNFSQNSSRINEVFGSILLVIVKLLMKKLEILKKNIKFRGGLLGLKAFLKLLLLRPIRRIHQGRYGVSVPALTKDHEGKKINTLYPGKAIRRIQAIGE
ncbi:hypothetical protein Tco_0594819 [Tanacetum coccineum]